MNITIDAGNTSMKVGVFENNNLLRQIPDISYPQLLRLVNDEYKCANVIICSVKQNPAEIGAEFTSVNKMIFLSPETKLPLQNNYETPSTLGVDRLAAVVGAKVKYPSQPCLVIDAGTCITYDFIDKDSNYVGGSISPGINLRFKALNQFTARLPLLEKKDSFELTGKNTNQAILSGVLNGVVAEVNGIIRFYEDKFPGIKLLICGGDAKFFESKIKPFIFVVPELVLIGLNRILEYNNDREN